MPHKAARVRWALEEPGLPMSTVKPVLLSLLHLFPPVGQRSPQDGLWRSEDLGLGGRMKNRPCPLQSPYQALSTASLPRLQSGLCISGIMSTS